MYPYFPLVIPCQPVSHFLTYVLLEFILLKSILWHDESCGCEFHVFVSKLGSGHDHHSNTTFASNSFELLAQHDKIHVQCMG